MTSKTDPDYAAGKDHTSQSPSAITVPTPSTHVLIELSELPSVVFTTEAELANTYTPLMTVTDSDGVVVSVGADTSDKNRAELKRQAYRALAMLRALESVPRHIQMASRRQELCKEHLHTNYDSLDELGDDTGMDADGIRSLIEVLIEKEFPNKESE